MARPKDKKLLHAHGCRRCRNRYEDACRTPKRNDLCITCRGGLAWRLLIDNRQPRLCCAATSRLVTKDEISRYSLGGEASWWICAQCKRTQVYKPNTNDAHQEMP